MSKSNSVVLDDKQIYEIKKLVTETRQFFGVHPNVPIGNDIRLLLDKKDILLCEYPFPDTNGTHTYGNITWFKTDNDTITFIGLNTSRSLEKHILLKLIMRIKLRKNRLTDLQLSYYFRLRL